MKAVLKCPNEAAVIIDIAGTSESIRTILNCTTMTMAMRDKRMATWVCYCDEDGIGKGLTYHFSRPNDGAHILGSVLFIGNKPKSGDAIGLTDDQVEYILMCLKNC